MSSLYCFPPSSNIETTGYFEQILNKYAWEIQLETQREIKYSLCVFLCVRHYARELGITMRFIQK